MVMNDELKSQPYITIHCTYGDRMKGLRYCELPKSVQTNYHSWCEKWTRAKPTLTPPAPQKHVVVTIIEPIYQPQPSPTIHHTYNEKLEMRRCYEILQSIQTCSILV